MLQARAGSGEREKKKRGFTCHPSLKKAGTQPAVPVYSNWCGFLQAWSEKEFHQWRLCTNRILILRCLGPMKKLQNGSRFL
jgi:hypothetical protein